VSYTEIAAADRAKYAPPALNFEGHLNSLT